MVATIKRGSSREKIEQVLKTWIVRKRKTDIRKYCGLLKMKEDPLKLQKSWRDEWE
jgi:hypothetical protein